MTIGCAHAKMNMHSRHDVTPSQSNTVHDELNAICQHVITHEHVHQECAGHEHQENTIIHALEALKTCNVEYMHSDMLFISNEDIRHEQLNCMRHIDPLTSTPLHLKLDILEVFSHPCNFLLTPPMQATPSSSQSQVKQGSSSRKTLSAAGQRNEIYFHSYSTVKEKKKRGRPRMYVQTFQKLDND